jgi:hypothetical protein
LHRLTWYQAWQPVIPLRQENHPCVCRIAAITGQLLCPSPLLVPSSILSFTSSGSNSPR